MAVVSWKSMTSPNFGPELAANANAIKLFRDSVSNVGDSITKLGEDREKSVTEDFMRTLMAEDTIEGREALIAQADTSFLDLEKVNKENYALGDDERALNTQLELEKRNVAAENIINTREIGEAKTIVNASNKREDDLLDDAIKYEESIDTRDNKREDKVRMLEQKFITEERLYGEMIQDERLLDEAAAKESLANIESELQQELALIEKDKDIEVKRIAENSKLSKKVLENEIKKGTGLEKIMNRYSINGQIVSTDISAAASASYNDAKQLMMDRGITGEQFDLFTGDNVNWNDRKLKGPNKFTFSYLGEEYHFGKKLFANFLFNNIGGNDESDMNALEAAINHDTIDKTNYKVGFNALTQLMLNNKETKTVNGKNVTTTKPIKLTKKDYQEKWDNYLKFKTDLRGFEPTDLNEFLINIDKF